MPQIEAQYYLAWSWPVLTYLCCTTFASHADVGSKFSLLWGHVFCSTGNHSSLNKYNNTQHTTNKSGEGPTSRYVENQSSKHNHHHHHPFKVIHILRFCAPFTATPFHDPTILVKVKLLPRNHPLTLTSVSDWLKGVWTSVSACTRWWWLSTIIATIRCRRLLLPILALDYDSTALEYDHHITMTTIIIIKTPVTPHTSADRRSRYFTTNFFVVLDYILVVSIVPNLFCLLEPNFVSIVIQKSDAKQDISRIGFVYFCQQQCFAGSGHWRVTQKDVTFWTGPRKMRFWTTFWSNFDSIFC